MDKQHKYMIKPKNGHREFTYLAIDYTDEQIEEMLKSGWVMVDEETWAKLVCSPDEHTYYIADDGSLYTEESYVPTTEEATQKKRAEIYRDYITTLTADTVSGEYHFSKSKDNIAKFMQAYAVAMEQGENVFNVTVNGEKQLVTLTADEFKDVLKTAASEQLAAYAEYKERMEKLAKATTLDEISEV